MDKPILEVHITMPAEYYEQMKPLGLRWGYKPSIIDGDPALGPGKNCYLTRSGPFSERVMETHMRHMLGMLNNNKIPVKRYKIEQILLDVIIPTDQQNQFSDLRTN